MQADAKGPQVCRPARVQFGARLVVAAHLGREEGGRARGGLDVVLVPSTRLDVGYSEVGELGHLPAEGRGGGRVSTGGQRGSAGWGLEEEGTCNFSSHSMFSGLMSRCRMEKECRYSSPTTESRIQTRIRGSLISSLRVIGADRSPPATNSMMRYMLL